MYTELFVALECMWCQITDVWLNYNPDTFHFLGASVFVPDQNAGAGQPAPRQHDVQLHQHLPDRGHQGAVESECWISLYGEMDLCM